MTITDIIPTEQFIEDYAEAPKEVRKKMDGYLEKILDAGRYPNSLRVHKVYSTEYLSGYVTTTGAHWRVLFEQDDDKVYLHRLLNHDKYDVFIKSVGRGK